MSDRIVDRFKCHYTRSYHSIIAVRKNEINNSHFIFNKNLDYNTTKVANRRSACLKGHTGLKVSTSFKKNLRNIYVERPYSFLTVG